MSIRYHVGNLRHGYETTTDGLEAWNTAVSIASESGEPVYVNITVDDEMDAREYMGQEGVELYRKYPNARHFNSTRITAEDLGIQL
jgi:uncharacterized protein YecE (DUF72 family)